MDQLVPILVFGGIAMGAFFFLRARPAFVITIRQGKPLLSRGNVSRRFLNELEQLCPDCGIDSARISGFIVRGRTSLRFSRIPAEHQQRFRNIFNLYQ